MESNIVYNIDLDEEIISHLSISDSVNELREEDLNSDLIEDPFAREIFEWQMTHLREHKKPATSSVLAEQFNLNLTDPLTAIGDLIGRLRKRYMRNNGREKMEELAKVYEEDPASVPDFMVSAGRNLRNIVAPKGDSYGTGDFERAIARYDRSLLLGSGPSFGFEELDAHLSGLRGVTFLLAPPKTWKSWATVNAAVENILAGKNTALRSLELPADETDMRIRCMVSGVPYWKYIRGTLSLEDRNILKQASEFLDDTGIYKVTKPPQGKRDIHNLIEGSRDDGADVIFIDQLQYVETDKGKQLGACDPGEYWPVMNALRDYSDDGPVWMVHQFNRSVMNADKMPEAQQAKAASSVEETATLILGLWANRDMRKSHVAELGILASRNYDYKSWEIGINLTNDCKLTCYGEFNYEPEED